jgi:uncharacterized protein (DUF305 family)
MRLDVFRKIYLFFIMENNITLTEEPTQQPVEQPTEESTEQPTEQQIRFVDVEVSSDNVALNLMVAFLNMAQRRGAYSMDESAKIWECVKRFIKQ